MEYEQPTKRSKKPFIIIGAVVVILAVVAIAIYLAIGGTKQAPESTADLKADTEQTVATNEEVQQNLKDLDATIKQANTDQTSAKASLKDGTSQIKVAN